MERCASLPHPPPQPCEGRVLTSATVALCLSALPLLSFIVTTFSVTIQSVPSDLEKQQAWAVCTCPVGLSSAQALAFGTHPWPH